MTDAPSTSPTTNYITAQLSNMNRSSLVGLFLPKKPKLFLSGSEIQPTWFASPEALLAGFATPDGNNSKLVSKRHEIEAIMELPSGTV
ncbi:hypothetical protein M427DRAFT_62551 [Gonapodya prolifera JEL478]|uniref:Uncharacterized protein n=1 Tax=Gonapodya prolifera (strain JEL478) TaxID=1344416 RepID=A0A139A0S3_GONPJ|nr:hypothetical protein M427DRAFT_62551 [Gonapodya prolifera JEL478]|eukprot:KXS10361.1 hypothetical protein M427DRAFT_62551 [Gonapodya prolifera JEL478]